MDFLILKAKVGFRTNHIDVGYNLRVSDIVTGLRYSRYILRGLSRILPVGFQIMKHPTISSALTKGDGTPVLLETRDYVGQILTQIDDTTPEADFTTEPICNDPGASFLFRIDCVNGQYSYRHIRALRDSWMADFLKTTSNTVSYSAPNLSSVTTADESPYAVFNALTPPYTPGQVLGAYLSIIRDCCAVYNPTTAPPITDYNQHVYATPTGTDDVFQFQRCSFKKPGAMAGPRRGRQRKWA